MSRSLQRQPDLHDSHSGFAEGNEGGRTGTGVKRRGGREATRYKFPDIRPFVSFEMGQFSRDLMVIAFLGGHIAFHPVQCVRPIYQSSSLSRLRVAVGGGGGRGCSEEKERAKGKEIETG